MLTDLLRYCHSDCFALVHDALPINRLRRDDMRPGLQHPEGARGRGGKLTDRLSVHEQRQSRQFHPVGHNGLHRNALRREGCLRRYAVNRTIVRPCNPDQRLTIR